MATIKRIDGRSIHQIQSGQVIVDLSSVVKELVENSIDAGANVIEVRFKNQGLDLIEVQDNGSGISPSNYASVARKHHTSKISSYSDIASLQTFGFRGEALASLSALSTLTVLTCIAEDAPKGSKLTFEASGELQSISVVALQRGTTISVEKLFHNLPVRRRELERNIKREWHKTIALLNQYACVQTNVKFSATQQPTRGRRILLFSTKGNVTTRENIMNIFGAKAMMALLPLDLRLDMKASCSASSSAPPPFEVRVVGHVSKPNHGDGRQTPDRQMFFVNGRPCALPQFARTFNNVYRSYNCSQSPFICVDIQLDTDLYDVNVSPDKRSILLHDQPHLLDTLHASLTELFESNDYTIPVGLTTGNVIPRQSAIDMAAREDSSPKFLNTMAPRTPSTLEYSLVFSSEDSFPKMLSKKSAIEVGNLTLSTAVPTRRQRLVGEWARKENEVVESRLPEKLACQSYQISPQSTSVSEDGPTEELLPRSPGKKTNFQDVQSTEVNGGIGIIERHPKVAQGKLEAYSNPVKPPATMSIPPETHPDKITAMPNEPAQNIASGISPSSFNAAYYPYPVNRSIVDYATSDQANRDNQNWVMSNHLENTVCSDDGLSPILGRQDRESLGPDVIKCDSLASLPQLLLSEVNRSGDGCSKTSVTSIDEILAFGQTFQDQPAPMMVESKAGTDFKINSDINHNGPARVAEPRFHSIGIGSKRKDASTCLVHRLCLDENAVELYLRQLRYKSMPPVGSTTWNDVQVADFAAADAGSKLSLIIEKSDFAMMRIVGQFNLGFIIAIRQASNWHGRVEGKHDELFIIDQHASDEKYNFERLQETTTLQSQRLVHPKRLQLTAIEEEIIQENPRAIAANGFKVTMDTSGQQPVGSRCQLTALPLSRDTAFDLKDLEELVAILGDWPSESSHIPRPSKVGKMLAMRACRSSVMIGKALSQPQMLTLVRNMGELDKPWNCPHGRPTMRHLCRLRLWDSARWKGDSERGSANMWKHYIALAHKE